MGNLGHISSDPDGGWSWTTAAVGAVAGGGLGAAYGLATDPDSWGWYAAGGAVGGGLIGGASFKSVPTYGLGGSEAGSLMGISGSRIVPSGFGKGLFNTTLDLVSGGARYLYRTSELNTPYLYFDIQKSPYANFDEQGYMSLLRDKLNGAGFKSDIEFKEYGIIAHIGSILKGDTYGTVTIRRPSGVREQRLGGHAERYSNSAKVLLFPHFTTLDYVNITIHELGHAIFGFTHKGIPKGNYMYKHIQHKRDDLKFNSRQKKKISSSPWGN
jgi:hypothetical protein